MGLFDLVMEIIIEIEGGFSDRDLRDDPGGKTNFGVTQGFLDDYHAKHPTSDMPTSVKYLNLKHSKQVYKEMLWGPLKLGEVPPYVALMVMDTAIHHGEGRAIRWLQMCLNIKDDGIVGPNTIRTSNEHIDRLGLIENYMGVRNWYLVTRPHASANKGWFRRRVPRIIVNATKWAMEGAA